MKKIGDLRNVDSAIVAVTQLIQPCLPDEVVAQAKAILGKSAMSKQQVLSRISSLNASGFLWFRADNRILVTPTGSVLAQESMPPRERDKFRLLHLNKLRYK